MWKYKLQATFQRLKLPGAPYRRASAAVWALFYLPLWLATLILAATGPQIQIHTAPLTNSNASSIYDSVYPRELARFPGYIDWILQNFNIATLLISTFVIAVSARAQSSYLFVAIAGASFAVAYGINDIFVAIFLGGVTHGLLLNIVFDAIGGLAYGFFIFVILAIFSYYKSIKWLDAKASILSAACVTVILSMAISYTTWVTIRVFYRPLTTRIEMIATLPTEGDYVADSDDWRRRSDKPDTFSLIPVGTSFDSLKALTPLGGGVVNWKPKQAGRQFSADLFILSGCYNDWSKTPELSQPTTSLGNVTSIRIGSGVDNITIDGDGELKIGEGNLHTVGRFWFSELKDGKVSKVQSFLSKRDTVSTDAYGELRIAAHSLLISGRGSDDIKIGARDIRLTAGNRQILFRFVPPQKIDTESIVKCQLVNLSLRQRNNLENSGIVEIPVHDPASGIMVRLRPIPLETSEIITSFSTIRISGSDGWITREGVIAGSGNLGTVSLLSIDRNIETVRVRGIPINASGADEITMVGDFHAALTHDAKLRATGEADALWMNLGRLNRTRWEEVPEGWKLPMLGALLAGLLAIFRLGLSVLKSRKDADPVEWIVTKS